MSEENKCENCGGEGLILQGESIKFTCSPCAGTGKAISSEVSASEEPEQPEPAEAEAEESFLGEASDVSANSSEEEAVPA
jgi:DnaJ-class molecular chaperone